MKKWKIINLIFLALFFLIFNGCRQDRVYQSTPIEQSLIGSFPETFELKGLTWIATEKAYCIPTCLQMIGEWAGIQEPVEYYNWITGFAWGGFHKGTFTTFMPISDPMRGIIFAVRYLGLNRIMYASADDELFVNAVKDAIYRGYPVMIMYDYNCLTDDTFLFPHGAVLTGYTEDEFIYYEPGFHEQFTPNAGTGRKAPISSMLEGISNLQRNYGVSEGYSFMIFEKTVRETDYSEVWEQNSRNLKGIRVPFIGITTGAQSCRSIAREIRKTEIPGWGWSSVLPVWFRFGEYSRSDNSDFIETRFGTDGSYSKIVRLLRQSSRKYGEIMDILEDPRKTAEDYRTGIPGLLLDIAVTEEDLSREIKKLP